MLNIMLTRNNTKDICVLEQSNIIVDGVREKNIYINLSSILNNEEFVKFSQSFVDLVKVSVEFDNSTFNEVSTIDCELVTNDISDLDTSDSSDKDTKESSDKDIKESSDLNTSDNSDEHLNIDSSRVHKRKRDSYPDDSDNQDETDESDEEEDESSERKCKRSDTEVPEVGPLSDEEMTENLDEDQRRIISDNEDTPVVDSLVIDNTIIEDSLDEDSEEIEIIADQSDTDSTTTDRDSDASVDDSFDNDDTNDEDAPNEYNENVSNLDELIMLIRYAETHNMYINIYVEIITLSSASNEGYSSHMIREE